MKQIAWILCCLVTMPLCSVAGELYRWKDDAGRIHYSDTPPPSAEQVVRKNISSGSEPGDEISYEAKLAQQDFPVTLYVSDTCTDPCAQGRALLRKRGIPYTEVMLKTKTEIEEFQQRTGSSNAPTLAVGRNYLGGFHESKWNAELDVAGYPKQASYRQLMVPPPTPVSPKSSLPPTEKVDEQDAGEGAPTEDIEQ